MTSCEKGLGAIAAVTVSEFVIGEGSSRRCNEGTDGAVQAYGRKSARELSKDEQQTELTVRLL